MRGVKIVVVAEIDTAMRLEAADIDVEGIDHHPLVIGRDSEADLRCLSRRLREADQARRDAGLRQVEIDLRLDFRGIAEARVDLGPDRPTDAGDDGKTKLGAGRIVERKADDRVRYARPGSGNVEIRLRAEDPPLPRRFQRAVIDDDGDGCIVETFLADQVIGREVRQLRVDLERVMLLVGFRAEDEDLVETSIGCSMQTGRIERDGRIGLQRLPRQDVIDRLDAAGDMGGQC